MLDKGYFGLGSRAAICRCRRRARTAVLSAV